MLTLYYIIITGNESLSRGHQAWNFAMLRSNDYLRAAILMSRRILRIIGVTLTSRWLIRVKINVGTTRVEEEKQKEDCIWRLATS